MMAKKKKKVPNLRFKGFTDDWEQHKLGEVVSVFDGTHQTPNYKTKGIMFLSVENINTLLSNKYISENEYRQRFKIKPQYLDVFMTRIGTIGKTNVITTHKPIAYYVSLALLRPQNIQSFFLSFIIQTSKVQQDIWKRTLQIAFPQKINKDEIGKVTLALPLQKEQIDIEKLLLKLDKLITLQQRKLELLKQLKKGFLQKMFADKDSKQPVLRFKGFHDDWERRKLGEAAEIIGGGTPSTQISNYWNGDINWYTPAEISNFIYTRKSKRKISMEGLENSSARLLPVGTVLFTSRAGIGKTAILSKEGTTNQGFQSIVPNKKLLDSYFIFSLTNELKKYGETHGAGSTFIEISGRELAKAPLKLPALKEQKKIGGLLHQVDELISLQHQKLAKYQSVKKSLLQQMFM